MKIEKETVINLGLTKQEKSALGWADAILLHLQKSFMEDTTLQAPETGEYFNTSELKRVRDILGMIHDNSFLREVFIMKY